MARNKKGVPTTPLVKPKRDLVKEYLKEAYSKPLIKIKNKPKSEALKLADIIKPIDSIVDLGVVIKDNIVVTDNDKASIGELADILSTEEIPNRIPIKVIRTFGHDDETKLRIFKEEETRRRTDDTRKSDYYSAISDEKKRHSVFLDNIDLMKLKFNIHLQKTYPWFVAERNIKNADIDRKLEEVHTRSVINKKHQTDIQQSKIDRMANEKKRKQTESKLRINKLDDVEIQSFFEEDILIEHRVKLAENEELDGLTKVERTIKEMKEMELRLGRSIIPHRDIVESEESDFDVKSITQPDDILIRPSSQIEIDNSDIQKKLKFSDLRDRLNNDDDSDYILMKLSGLSKREMAMMREQLAPKEFQLQLMKQIGLSENELEHIMSQK